MNTVLGIDLGTQSLKVLFYDFEKRRVVVSESVSLMVSRSDDGTAEQNAGDWLDALATALGRVDEAVRHSVRALSVSGQQHGFVPLDAAGEVLAPVKLWCDTATTLECAEITDAFGGREAVISELGNAIAPGYTASKIRWMKKAMPRRYALLDKILLPHDYINYALTGEHCMEAGDASGTGFFDVRRRSWSRRMLEAIDPNRDLLACLPTPRTGNAIVGRVDAAASQRFGLPVGIPVAIGGGDNMLGAIGTGNVRPGRLTMSLGTSGTVYAFSQTPVVDEQGSVAAFCSSTGGWLPLLCTMNCTVATEAVRNLFDLDLVAFEAQVAAAPRGSQGLITVPFLNGERTPDLPRARGVTLGLSTENTSARNHLRSAMEGATFALRYGIDRLGELGVMPEEIVLTGGGSRSATWRQIVADVCGKPVVTLEEDEGAGFGALLQALELVEAGCDLAELVDEHLVADPQRAAEPERAAVDDYAEIYEHYRVAADAVATLYSQ